MMREGLRVQLMDTTLRDGEQTQGVSFSPDEKVNIARALLQSLKVDRIEIASAGVSHGEKSAVTQIQGWAAEHGFLEQVEVLGFVDGSRSVDWVVDSGGGACLIFLPKLARSTAGYSFVKRWKSMWRILTGQLHMPETRILSLTCISKTGRMVILTVVITFIRWSKLLMRWKSPT